MIEVFLIIVTLGFSGEEIKTVAPMESIEVCMEEAINLRETDYDDDIHRVTCRIIVSSKRTWRGV